MNQQNLYFLPSGTVDEFNVVIEIPYGSQNKYELDAETGALFLDRVLYGAAFYPANYGFIPSTKADDGDAVDVMVFMTNPVPPATVVKCRALGIIRMEDSGDMDSKVLAVPLDDPHFFHMKEMSDVPEHSIKEISDFFENMQKYKKGEWKKHVNTILGLGDRSEAEAEIEKHLNNYPSFIK
jgi:inorganic pyrophosphatase